MNELNHQLCTSLFDENLKLQEKSSSLLALLYPEAFFNSLQLLDENCLHIYVYDDLDGGDFECYKNFQMTIEKNCIKYLVDLDTWCCTCRNFVESVIEKRPVCEHLLCGYIWKENRGLLEKTRLGNPPIKVDLNQWLTLGEI